GGRTDRDLRLGLRWTHRGPSRDRPASARAGPLPRRHRPPALRSQADRRGEGVRPGLPGPPGRTGRQGPGDRLQLGERRRASRCAREVPGPGRGGDPPRDPQGRSRQPDWADRRDLHPGDRGVDGLRRCVRSRAAPGAAHPGVSPFRGVRGSRGHRWRGAAGRRARVPGPADRRRRRHPDPRLHPLPPADRRRVAGDGGPGHLGQQRRGDREGRLQAARAPRHPARRLPGTAGAPLPHHRSAGRVRAARAPVPRAGAAVGPPVRAADGVGAGV
ncbi:MAG: Glutamate racemase, partial [uncultured Nocardioidaceae bacterium]